MKNLQFFGKRKGLAYVWSAFFLFFFFFFFHFIFNRELGTVKHSREKRAAKSACARACMCACVSLRERE